MLDLVALRIDADRFGDQEITVALDFRIADEEDDALVRQRRRKPSQQQDESETYAAQEAHGLLGANEIVGAARAASSSSKNGAGVKCIALAMSELGNDWISMLRSRTVPL